MTCNIVICWTDIFVMKIVLFQNVNKYETDEKSQIRWTIYNRCYENQSTLE